MSGGWDRIGATSRDVPEITYLTTDGGMPRPASDYPRVEITEDRPLPGDAFFFNAAEREMLNRAHVVADEIVFAPDEGEGPLDRFHEMQVLDYLVIETKRLVIKAPLSLPGTDLDIYAETIEFIDTDPDRPALIDTSPVDSAAMPVAANASTTPRKNNLPATPGEDGANGEAAGDLNLYVSSVLTPENAAEIKRFVMKGSDGRPGGKAAGVTWGDIAIQQNVKDGSDLRKLQQKAPSAPKAPEKVMKQLKAPGFVKNKVARNVLGFAMNAARPPVKWVVDLAKYKKDMENYRKKKAAFDAAIANGNFKHAARFVKLRNPVPGGKPGDGGGAGQAGLTDIAFASLFDRRGGASGPKTARVVGITPHRSWHTWYNKARKANAVSKNKIFDQAKAPSVSLPEQTGQPGVVEEIAILDDMGDLPWVTADLLMVQLDRLEDLYLIGEIKAVEDLANEILRWLRLGKDDDLGTIYPPDDPIQVHLYRLETLLDRLEQELDFFGNPPGWVPNLSFDVNFQIFEKEVENHLQVLLLSDWVARQITAAEKRREAMEALIETETVRIAEERERAETIRDLIPDLEAKGKEIWLDIDRFKNSLNARKEDIAAKFKRDEAMRIALEAAFGVLDTLMFVLPAKLLIPAAIGRGIYEGATAIENMQEPHGGAGAFDQILAEDDLLKAQQDLENLEFEYDEDGGKQGYHDQIASLADRLSIEIRTAIETQTQAAIHAARDFDAAMRMQARLDEDPQYQSLVEELVVLLSARRIYEDELAFAKQSLGEAIASILESTWSIDKIRNALADEESTEFLGSTFALMRKRAQQRLTRYQYVLAKSFEFRMLEPAKVNFHASDLVEQIQDLVSDSIKRGDGAWQSIDLTGLVSVYKETLREMTTAVLQGLNEERYSARAPQTYTLALSPAQIRDLNRRRKITIDLKDHGILAKSDRDARVLDMWIDVEESTFALDREPRAGDLPVTEFSFQVDPHSYVPWDDGLIGFHHRAPRYTSILPWNFVWQHPHGLQPRTKSGTGDGILKSILHTDDDMLLSFTPSAHGSFTLHLEDVPIGDAERVYPLKVEALTLKTTIRKSKKI